MNLFTLNGSAFNGYRLIAVVAASASFVCAASFNAVGAKMQDALAPTPGTGGFVASATHIQSALATLPSSSLFHANAQHINSAHADIASSAGLQAFVVRRQNGIAYATGTATMVAIPASVLAYSLVSGDALVVVGATKIQPGRSVASTAALVDITVTPTVTRYVQANLIAGGAVLRIEPAINGEAWSYADVLAVAGVSVVADGLVIRPGAAELLNSATVLVKSTHIKPGIAAPMGVSLVVTTEPHIIIGGLAFIVCGGAAQATALLTRMANASAIGQGGLQVIASVNHGSSRATVQGLSTVTFSGKAIRFAVSEVMNGVGKCSSEAMLTKLPSVNIATTATIQIIGTRTTNAEVTFDGYAVILNALADQTIRLGGASIAASADATAQALATRQAGCNLISVSVFLADAQCNVNALANVAGTTTVTVLALTNADSFDPDGRTFYSPLRVTEFSHAFVETELRRAS